nr:LysR substrate-binding domain-containing protein [Paucibacter aquatile]
MDQLKRMAVLATVVEQGSFVAAARQLQTTTSAVSQQVRALERDMGITLLHRSTRKLSLTPAGERFHAGCAAMLSAARGAQQQLIQLRDAPEGELRIAAPVGFARQLGPALAPLLQAHPGLSLHLEVEDGFTDLVDRRIDLAIRFGRLPDSSWVAQRIGEKSIALYAAPAYLAQRGVPAQLSDLADTGHDWLALRSGTDQPLALSLRRGDDVSESVQAGHLLPLLPGLQLPPLPIHALSPQRDAQPAKVRHAIAALRAFLSAAPPG